jgi:hypothetical protein
MEYRIMKSLLVASLLSLVALCGTAVLAGEVHDVACVNGDCGFKAGKLMSGVGRIGNAAIGYCGKCKLMVSISWKREEGGKSPLIPIWDPKSGQPRKLCQCLKCKTLCFAAEKIADLKYCPKCGKETLQHKLVGMWD